MKPYPRWNDSTGRFEIVRNLNEDGSQTETLHVFPEAMTNAVACAAFDQWMAAGADPEALNGGIES